MKKVLFPLSLLPLLLILACSEDATQQQDVSPDSNNNISWLIPKQDVFDGGVGRDGIPSVDQPKFLPAEQGNFLTDEDRVLGVVDGKTVKAYPHKIMDWHEIVNDVVNHQPVSIIYCPLTGTGTVWDRTINGDVTTFGVSGLIYKNNLIPYDRKTNSYWSQMEGKSVAGEVAGTSPQFLPILETTWREWKNLFPETQIMSLETGFSRSYDFLPYFDYRDNHNKVSFPIEQEDDRLQRKELVLGLIYGSNAAKAYPLLELGDSVSVVQENLRNTNYIVVGSEKRNFAMCFEAEIDGEALLFRPVQDRGAIVMQDLATGTYWDVFGRAVDGELLGQSLKPTLSYIGYWFAWADFHPGMDIYNGELSNVKEEE